MRRTILFAISALLCFAKLDFVFSQRAPPTFRYLQFFPTKSTTNATESQALASGPIRDVIRRNSARFRKVLVRNANTYVQFSTDDSRYMTSRAKSKLDVLASRVQSSWGNSYKVRVLKAWTDDVDKRNFLSLHYEGRALEIQMSDRDGGKLGRLAGLAAESGFDWVYYATRDKLILSVIPDVCQTKLDLALVIDTSGSVSWQNFLKVRDFLKKVIDFFNIGRDETHVALISYSYGVTREFPLNRYYDKTELKKAIDRMKYEGGSTATGDALYVMRTWAFSQGQGARNDKTIPKIGILLTDGRSNTGRNVYYAAIDVRKAGISMFVVGVGHNLRMSEINAVASDPDSTHVFRLDTFYDLNGFVDQLSTVSCDEGAAVSQCDSAETSVGGGSFKYFKGQFDAATKRVTIEVEDKIGKNFLYLSHTNKNPGPLDSSSLKATGDRSPRALTADLTKSSSKIVYMAVQGQLDNNKFLISIWDSLFLQDKYMKEVYENANTGVNIIKVVSFQSGYTFRYSISHGNDKNRFHIDPNSGQISARVSFDREEQSFYSLVVVAQDVKLKCHKGRTQVDIKIKDRNDNKPKFTRSPYTVNIREDTPVGQLIQTVSATDKDEGENAKVEYYKEKGLSFDFFNVDLRSGKIYLSKALDYETQKKHTLTLKAVDGGNPPKSDLADLVVNVIDVNEAPYFTTPCARTAGGTCLHSVVENHPAGAKIMTLAAQDPDTAKACVLQFSITSSDKYYFKIDKQSGHLTTSRPLDRELKEIYKITVRVTDCGGLYASTIVTVKAVDENDNDPVFSAKQYTSSIAENQSPKAVVQVKATDADAGNNGKVSYSITGGNTGTAFSVDANSGWIRTTKALDREKTDKYVLTVQASDHGTKPRTATTTVIIQVTDVNDNKPEFSGNTAMNVMENVAKATTVGKVTVSDKDEGLNGRVRCSIAGGNVGYAFSIDAGTCTISVFGAIDRETRASYSLTVEAADYGQPSLSARKTYTISVQDENDNDPKFDKSTYTYKLKENTPVNTKVDTIKATDKDAGANGEVEYTIKGGDETPPKFLIEDESGTLTLIRALDFGTKSSYSLTLQVADKGKPIRYGSSTVRIIVEDTNDFDPVFTKKVYQKSIPEDTPKHTPVLKVAATDKDSGPSGKFLFYITAPKTSPFTVNAVSGQISTSKTLDYETTKSYTLTMMVQDQGPTPRWTKATVEIKITDVNDNNPRISPNPAIFRVSEAKSSGFHVGSINAKDLDDGVNKKLTFSSPTLRVPFHLKEDGGIYVNGTLDYETAKEFIMNVKVVDGGVPQRSDVGKAIIKITDANDNKPVFRPVSCSVLENSKNNAHVCYVTATDADSGANAEVTYKMSASGVFPFVMNKNTGAIKTSGNLDRENKAEYTAKVTATDGGVSPNSEDITIKITIRDENDNVPKFLKNQYSFTVTEEMKKKVDVGEVKADDADIGKNAELAYSFVSGNIANSFSIDADTGKITATEDLDREERDSYKLGVRVRDKGSPTLSSEMIVTVNVLDINDNDPIFRGGPYKTKIREDAAERTKVIQVSATDADAGNNGAIVYSITDGKNKDQFVIDQDTGVINTQVGLDYETIASYELTITATDKGTTPRSSTTKVSISVINVDDNAPEFGNITEAKVSEGVNIGSAVVKFNAKDKDGGDLTYGITGGNDEGSFELDSKLGELRVKKRLDRETTAFYNISVTVTDASSHATVAHLPIRILDVNDNNPIFDNKKYTGEIVENNKAGAKITTVHATDKDIGTNKDIKYSIESGNEGDAFSLDPDTGVITTLLSLNRETHASYHLRIKAVDLGSPPLSSWTTVDIKVIDVNDNYPIFERNYKPKVPENGKLGNTITIVKANDKDTGRNAEMSYSLISENGHNVTTFAIDKVKGKIITLTGLDREKTDTYSIMVKATDNGIRPKYASKVILLKVLDENDNPPEITSPSKIDAIKEDIAVKTEIAVIKAEDKDIDMNGKFTFKIVSGNVKNAFAIDAATGSLTVNSQLNREDISSYTLRIQVTDQGIQPLQSHKDYKIDLIDVNDNCPEFTQQRFEGDIKEDAKEGTLVMTINATDADLGVNAKLSYSIKNSPNSDHFTCNSQTGEIKVGKKELDFEAVKVYNLKCEVTDGNCKDDVPCDILVENVNDNSPIFDKVAYSAHVKEDIGFGKSVLPLKATDKDDFGQIWYEIVTPNSGFTVEKESGEIRTAVALDRETKDKYFFVAKATDNGQPEKSTQVNVTILIDDVNDNKPKFAKDSDTVTVQENKKEGAKVLTLVATDKDLGLNKEIVYEILTSAAKSNFAVDPNTGVVTTQKKFDREKISRYTVRFVAKDKGKPFLSSTPFVLTVNVGDENDNNPKFSKAYNTTVSEGVPEGTNVQGVLAVDNDILENAEISYRITEGNEKGYFAIGNVTGVITVKKKLDRETHDKYTLKVEATDDGSPPLSGSTTVDVLVTDINDNAPVFEAKSLVGSVMENQKKGSKLGKVVATDKDLGENAKISFFLSSNDKFKIDPDSGEITTLQVLDREEKSTYIIEVTAKDHGEPPLSTTETYTVNVLDEDDNCPVFNPKVYRLTISEGVKVGSTILRVSASDRDVGTNADLVYAIKSGDDRFAFQADSKTGDIKVVGDVDREYKPLYHLRVRAGKPDCGVTDNGTNVGEGGTETKKNDSLADVYIHVTDVNDNPPRFSAGAYSYRFKNSRDVSLMNITAVDKDLGDGGKVMFKLVDVRGFKTSTQEGRDVIVQAYDLGTPSLARNTTVKVINDLQCGAMSFSLSEKGALSVVTLCGFTTSPAKKTIEVGKTFTLSCEADGNLAPEYHWLRDGNIVTSPSKSGTLDVTNVGQDNEGEYSCVAYNKAGNIQSQPVRVEVVEKPRILEQPEDISVELSSEAVMTVKAIGDPEPEYQWKKGPNLYYEGKEKGKGPTLTLEKTILQDEGEYSCVITNDVAKVETRKLYLKVFEKETVVEMVMNITKPNENGDCNLFIREKFEKELEKILDKKVSVTDVKKSNVCNVTACNPNPCQNKKKCVVTETGYQCVCGREWTGKNCEIDVDECKSQPPICQAGGACTNKEGSYMCKCPNQYTGRYCQLNATSCKANPCGSNERCVPTNDYLPKTYRCIPKAQGFQIVLNVGTGAVDKYKLEDMLNRLLKQLRPQSTRRRRAATADIKLDFADCSVHVVKGDPDGNGNVKVDFVLVCPPKIQKQVAGNDVFLCGGIMKGADSAKSCGMEGKPTTTAAPKKKPPPSKVEVKIVVRDKDTGKALSAGETTDLIKSKDVKEQLAKSGIDVQKADSAYKKGGSGSDEGSSMTGVIVGVCVALLIIIIAVVIAVIIIRRRKDKSQSQAFMISGRAEDRRQSKEDLLHADISMNAMDSPGSPNKGFEKDGVRDSYMPAQETFMFEMPEKITKGNKTTGIESLTWYRGVFTEQEAEKYFEHCKVPGSYMAYKTADAKIFLAVKAPDGGPKVRHIPITKSSNGEFVANVGSMAPIAGESMNFIVEHFRVTPMTFGDTTPDVVLTEPWQKTAL